MHIHVDDTVQVISGEDKGTQARVLRVLTAERKLVVEGVNRVYKHMRKSQKNPQGGRLSKEMPINISKVLLLCPKCGKASRIGSRFRDDGSKERFCKACGGEISGIAPARPAHAKKSSASAGKTTVARTR